MVLEAANFDPVSVARTARRHKLPSEASRRFERGVDPTIGLAAATRAAGLLVEFGGGTIVPTATGLAAEIAADPISMPITLPAALVRDRGRRRTVEPLHWPRSAATVEVTGDSWHPTPAVASGHQRPL